MPILTKGQLHVTPLGLSTEASITQLHELFLELGGAVAPTEGGWGSIHDSVEYLDLTGPRQFKTLPATIEDADDGLPARLKLRRYFFEVDKRALKFVGTNHSDQALALRALDIVISGSETEKLVLVTSRDGRQISAHVVRPMLSLMEWVGHGGTLSFENSPLSVLDSDFFLWLMYRCHEAPLISEDFVLKRLRDIAGMDSVERTARLAQGVSLDRAELLAMIMSGVTDFGPATIEFFDEGLMLDGCVKIHLDGGFSPVLGESSYQTSSADDREDLGPRIVDDVAYRVLPRLIAAHNGDVAWREGKKTEYVSQAQSALTALLKKLTE